MLHDDWIPITDDLPNHSCVLLCKRKDGNVIQCYFHVDGMWWLYFYNKDLKLSKWQCRKTLTFLHDITHYKKIA